MDDKDTSSFDTMVQTATNAIGEAAKSAVVPTQATKEEALAEQTNEQMLVGDAAIAPEAVPAPTAPKKSAAKKRKKKLAGSATGKKRAGRAARRVATIDLRHLSAGRQTLEGKELAGPTAALCGQQ